MNGARFVAALAFVALLVGAGVASAKEWNHPSGFAFTMPDAWTAAIDGDVLTASNPSGEVSIVFFVPADADTLEAALTQIETELKKIMTDVKEGEPQEVTINGMTGVLIDASGKIDGVGVEMTAVVVEKDGSYLMAFATVAAEKAAEHAEEVSTIILSLKK